MTKTMFSNGLDKFVMALDDDEFDDDMRRMAGTLYERITKDRAGTPADKINALGALSLCAGAILAQILVQQDDQQASDIALRRWMDIILTNAMNETRDGASGTGLH